MRKDWIKVLGIYLCISGDFSSVQCWYRTSYSFSVS